MVIGWRLTCFLRGRYDEKPPFIGGGGYVLEAGVEPATNSLGNCCSIQLSYPSIIYSV